MNWIEVTIKTTHEAIDIVGGLLDYLGFEGYIIDDEEELNDFIRNNTMYWDYIDDDLLMSMKGLSQIRLYIEADQLQRKLESLSSALGNLKSNSDMDFGSLDISLSEVDDQDWETAWKQYYKPIEIGERLLVNPCWQPVPEDCDRIVISLDPGMIFGTGAHASTRMCLEALEKNVFGGVNVLDLGSGSGILSIAAIKLGAKCATGVDIDPKAEKVARENASISGLDEDRFKAITGDVLQDDGFIVKLGKYDVVMANIVADVLIALAPKVNLLLNKGAKFICSGILNTRRAEVEKAVYDAGFEIILSDEQEDWVMLVCAQGDDVIGNL